MKISERIKDFAHEKRVSLSWIAKSIGSTNAGFYKMIDANSFKVETLQKIADVLNVDIIVFFPTEKSITVDLRIQLFKSFHDSTESMKVTIEKSIYAPELRQPLVIVCENTKKEKPVEFLTKIYDGIGLSNVNGTNAYKF